MCLSRCKSVRIMRTSLWVIVALWSCLPRLKRYPVTGRPLEYPLTPRGSYQPRDSWGRFVLLPSESPRKMDVKTRQRINVPIHRGALWRSGRPMHHSPGLQPWPVAYAIRTLLRPRFRQSYINDSVVSCMLGHLYGCSCSARSAAW